MNIFTLIGNNNPRIIISLTIFVLCCTFRLSAQERQPTALLDRKITISFAVESLDKAFEQLRKEAGISIYYDKSLVSGFNVKATRYTQQKIQVILDDLVKNTGLTYQVSGKGLIIKSLPKAKSQSSKSIKPGKISGTVLDDQGAPLPGANVWIKDLNTGATSDYNGYFNFSIAPGTYTVEISFVSYQKQEFTNVEVNPGKSTPLAVKLVPETTGIEEVKVTATTNKATTIGMRTMQMKSASLMDVMSAEAIAKIPDSDVGSALKRVTGVTTVDNKYVVVRSMGDRWNQAVVDGINMPSTDAYSQHFSFDIIPNAIVDGIVVNKTPTPDQNANFAGAVVEVKTKDIPAKNFINFSLGTSYHTLTTFQTVLTKQRGKWDYFGYDDGTRDAPNISTTSRPSTEEDQVLADIESSKYTQDNFTDYDTRAPLNNSYQFSIGQAFDLPNNKKWGFVGAVTLKNKQETEEIVHTQRGKWVDNSSFFAINTTDGGKTSLTNYGYKNYGNSYTYKSNLSGIFNTGFMWDNHHLTLRNTYSHFYKNQLTQIIGTYNGEVDPGGSEIDGDDITGTWVTVDYPTYLTLLQNKIEGSHSFLGEVEVTWYAARTYTKKDTKDCTVSEVSTGWTGEYLQQSFTLKNTDDKPVYRMFNWNNETDYNFGATLKKSFLTGNAKTDVKIGAFAVHKKAENQQNKYYLELSEGNDNSSETIYMSWTELLSGKYYNWENFIWVSSVDAYTGKYVAKVNTYSPFAMVDQQFTPWFRLVWGLRAEYYEYIEISNQEDDEVTVEGEYTVGVDDPWVFMPSVNATLNPCRNVNLRLCYNKSVIRPQFSERMQISYYNPILAALMSNSSDGVKSSYISSYDFKTEWYPAPGEIVSGGIYYKYIDNPIEQINSTTTSNHVTRYVTSNAVSADLIGLEFEINKSFSFLGAGEMLDNLFFSSNASFNRTTVVSSSTSGNYTATRPLAGQSPYTYNLGLNYQGNRLNFGMAYNAVGDQYLIAAYNYQFEEIAMPRKTVDAQVSFKLLKKKNLEVKLTAKNIFRSDIRTYNNDNSYSKRLDDDDDTFSRNTYIMTDGATDKYDENIDEIMFHSRKGSEFGFSLKYGF